MKMVACDICKKMTPAAQCECVTPHINWCDEEYEMDICKGCAAKLGIYRPNTEHPYRVGQYYNLIVMLLRQKACEIRDVDTMIPKPVSEFTTSVSRDDECEM